MLLMSTLLQALEIQLQVQQYAEAAGAAMRAQEKLASQGSSSLTLTSPAPPPSNLGSVLQRSPSSNAVPQKLPTISPTKAKTSSGVGAKPSTKGGDDLMDILRSCQKKAVSSRVSHTGEAAAASAGSYASQVSDEARRAAGLVRATSMRQKNQE